MAKADTSYRLLFSNPALLRDLLLGVIDAPWVHQLNLQALTQLSVELVSDKLDQRRADLVWKIARKDDEPAYVVLLLEHQSSNDNGMALRMAVYSGLLLQSLIRSKMATLGNLPVVIPLVVYCGSSTWSAALRVRDLCSTMVQGCESVALDGGYFLLDAGMAVRSGKMDILAGLTDSGTTELRSPNLAALLFKMEHNQGVEDVQQCLHKLLSATRGPQHDSVRKAFESWVKYVLVPRSLEPETINFSSLQEFADMLQEDPRSWVRKWRLEGVEIGKQEGIQLGEALLLQRLLTRRFGPLPQTVLKRIASASITELELWGDRVLDAASLDAVFAD